MDDLDSNTLRALKRCINGMNLIETTSEYTKDEDSGELIMVKQKRVEKAIPPNVDILKLIYQNLMPNRTDYETMTDEELKKEKYRLLNELKEMESDSRKSKSKS